MTDLMVAESHPEESQDPGPEYTRRPRRRRNPRAPQEEQTDRKRTVRTRRPTERPTLHGVQDVKEWVQGRDRGRARGRPHATFSSVTNRRTSVFITTDEGLPRVHGLCLDAWP